MRRFLAIFLLAILLPAAFAAEPVKTKPAATVEQPTVVIKSRAALRHYLQATAHKKSPLDALSPGARTRFLSGLRFGDGSLMGFIWADLIEELDRRPQMRAILSLFGAGDYADGFTPTAKPLRGNDPPTAVDRDYTAFYTADIKLRRDDKTRAARAQRQYQKKIAGHSPVGLNAHDLSLLYRAALSVASLEPGEPSYLHDARKALDALDQHGQATSERVTRLHDALVAARHFSAANQLATDYPDASLKKLLTFKDTSPDNTTQTSVLLLDPAAGGMLRKSINLDQGQHIVIIAGCHLSVDAVTSIEAHPDIAQIFERHGLWLASQTESLAAVTIWNQDHPHQPMNVAWADNQWKRITSWAMPTFYIFKHGKLVDQWAGWPADTGLATLRQHLTENGFLDSAQ